MLQLTRAVVELITSEAKNLLAKKATDFVEQVETQDPRNENGFVYAFISYEKEEFLRGKSNYTEGKCSSCVPIFIPYCAL